MPEPTPPVWQSHTSWGVEIGGFRLAITRTRETHGARPAPPAPRSGWPMAVGAFTGVGALTLLVVGATAAPRLIEPARYTLSIPIPATAAPHLVTHTTRRAAVGRRTPRTAPLAALSGGRFDAADEPHVARAMATGAFQEWEDDLGQRRFLTAGELRVDGARACRDLALLIRLADGGSRVRSAERCKAAEPAPEPAAPIASEN